MSTVNNHSRILQSRYFHLLNPPTSLESVTEVLCDKGVLTLDEKTYVLNATKTENGKREMLCHMLTEKGASRLPEISQILTPLSELKRQHEDKPALEGHKRQGWDQSELITTSSTTTSTSSTDSSASSSSSSSGHSQGYSGGAGYSEGAGNPLQNGGVQGAPPNVSEGSKGRSYMGLYGSQQHVSDSDWQQQGPFTKPGVAGVGKRLKTDVPDPPMEIFRAAASTTTTTTITGPSKMEDAFVILFFTFITQQLQHFWKQHTTHPPHDQHTQSRDHDYREPYLSSSCGVFPWLKVDIPFEEARDFFPAEVIKGVMPNSSDPVALKVSVLLEAFQQFLRAFDSLKRENVSLQRRAKMYDELVRKNRILETKLNQMQAGQYGIAPVQGGTSPSETAMREKIADLEEQLKQVESLQKAYIRSEERCKQLVEVTQQWAIECEEKLQLIQVLEKETEQLKTQNQQLDVRVTKYKKYWSDTKDLPKGRVSDSQFEELRSELASRRELYDQVLTQRDEANKKMKVLMLEVDSLKDHNVQLLDRAANFKVQAQAKEPSVREMSIVLEQKGRLEREVEKLRKNYAELSDKTLALEILVEDLTAKDDHMQGPNSQPKRAQAMVFGPTHPHPSHHLSPNPSPIHAKPPHGSQLLAPPMSSSYHHYNRVTKPPSLHDEDISLASSDGESGSFSSHDSTSDRHLFARGHSSAPPSQTADSQLRSRDPLSNLRANSLDIPLKSQEPPVELHHTPLKSTDPSTTSPFRSHNLPTASHDIPLRSHDIPLRSCDIPLRSRDIPLGSRDPWVAPPSTGSDDYTQQIRYPNNSRILVRPLLDEDMSLKSENVGVLKLQDPPKAQGDKSAPKEPFYCDRSHFDYYQRHSDQQQLKAQNPNQPTAVLTPGSAFLSTPNNERKCPVCQHVFLTLSEREFESHVAVCSK